MFSFVKTLIALVVLAALAYFVFFVPLGEKTLYRHLVGISRTDEANELKEELSKKASDVKDDVVSKLPSARDRKDGAREGERAGDGKPLSKQSDEDRRALEEVIERAATSSR